MNRLEIILGSLALISLSTHLLGTSIGGPMLVASFSALATFYFYFAFPIFNQFPLKMAIVKDGEVETVEIKRMVAHLFGMAIAIIIVGILFKLMQWPNANLMLIAGVVGLTIAEFMVFAWIKKSKSTILVNTLKRLAIFDIIGIVFLTA